MVVSLLATIEARNRWFIWQLSSKLTCVWYSSLSVYDIRLYLCMIFVSIFVWYLSLSVSHCTFLLCCVWNVYEILRRCLKIIIKEVGKNTSNYFCKWSWKIWWTGLNYKVYSNLLTSPSPDLPTIFSSPLAYLMLMQGQQFEPCARVQREVALVGCILLTSR